MPTGWTLSGTDLRTNGYNLRTTSGWDSFPGLKMPVYENGLDHGSRVLQKSPRYVYKPKTVFLGMDIFPFDKTTGDVLTTAEEHIEENLHEIISLLHSPTGAALPVTKTLASGLVKSTEVYPIDMIPINGENGLIRAVTLILEMPYPLWHGVLKANPSLSGTFNLTNDGNAPVADFEITFTSAATLTHNPSGLAITSDAAGLVYNIRSGIVSGGVDSDVTVDEYWVMEMQPGVNSFTTTAGVGIDFYDGYLT